MDMKRRGKQLLGLLVGVLGIYYIVRNIEFWEVYTALRSTEIMLYAGSFVVLTSIYFLMAQRWRGILGEKDVHISLWESFRQVSISSFVNSFLPLRAGDVYRGHLASDESKGTLETSIMVMMERMLDLIVLLVLVFAVVLAFYPGNVLMNYLIAGMGLIAIFFLGMYVMRSISSFSVSLIDKVYQPFREAMLQNFTTGRKVELFLLTGLIWIVGIGRTGLVVWALGIDVSWQLISIVTFLWALISGIPITPGAIETVDAAVFLVMTEWGVAAPVTVSFILLNRVVLHALPFLLGGYFYFDENLRRQDL
jgi:uncharacterized protein (TIRG00374 family)